MKIPDRIKWPICLFGVTLLDLPSVNGHISWSDLKNDNAMAMQSALWFCDGQPTLRNIISDNKCILYLEPSPINNDFFPVLYMSK